MKKFIAILIMAGLSVCPGFAENTENASLNYGVRLGVGINSVISDSKRDVYPMFAGLGGEVSFDLTYKISQKLYLHPAVGVEYRDFRAHVAEESVGCGPGCGGTWEGFDVNSLVYLDIPVMVQWRIPRTVYFEAGPFFDVMLLSHEENAAPEKYRSERCFEDKRFGAGVAVGVGHEFSSGFFIDTRVAFQLTDVADGNRSCLTDVFEMTEFWEENGEYHTKVIERREEYVGGDYYKLLKFQIGFGYWF